MVQLRGSFDTLLRTLGYNVCADEALKGKNTYVRTFEYLMATGFVQSNPKELEILTKARNVALAQGL